MRTLLTRSRLNGNRVCPALPVSPPAGHHTHSAQPAAPRRRAAAANRTHPEPSHTWSETQAAAGTCVTACVCSLSCIPHTHTQRDQRLPERLISTGTIMGWTHLSRRCPRSRIVHVHADGGVQTYPEIFRRSVRVSVR